MEKGWSLFWANVAQDLHGILQDSDWLQLWSHMPYCVNTFSVANLWSWLVLTHQLGTVDSTTGCTAWFDHQPITWFAGEVPLAIHWAIILTNCSTTKEMLVTKWPFLPTVQQENAGYKMAVLTNRSIRKCWLQNGCSLEMNVQCNEAAISFVMELTTAGKASVQKITITISV